MSPLGMEHSPTVVDKSCERCYVVWMVASTMQITIAVEDLITITKGKIETYNE